MAAAGIVERARVERLLAGAWERRVTRVVAGGGYGKTTALRRLTANRRAGWLALAPAHREVEALSARVAEVLGIGMHSSAARRTPAIGAADRQSLAEGEARAVCEGLDARDKPVMLVFDDVEWLADEDSATQFLSALCLQAPSHVHIVLSGRRLPAMRLGSTSGKGELLDIAAPDLAFTLEETAGLLHARFGQRAAGLAEDCWSLTTGWPAAIQLIVDRLERLEPTEWSRELAELRLRRSRMWRDFASELIEQEPPLAQRILDIASIVPVVDAELLSGLGVGAPAGELDSLQSRGLLVPSGERRELALSPVLSDVVAERLQAARACELRVQAIAWLEGVARFEQALECASHGSGSELVSFLRRCGRRLVTDGYGSRVVEMTADLGKVGDLEVEAIRAEALVAIGDWDAAIELFGAVRRQMAPDALPAPTAWRFGALLYLRGEIEEADTVLSAAYTEGAGTGNDALVSAWLSSTLWGRGKIDEAGRKARVAVDQAEASGDPAARAAAYVAMALWAASIGDREQNERCYRLARTAATEAGDAVQLARIYANLSSKAVEEGDYARAVRQADAALTASAGHNLFAAIALSNKAEARLHSGDLEEARALLVEAIEMFERLGSLTAASAYTVLGALEYERGHVVQARIALERAQRLGEKADDVHSIVLSLCGLADVLAQDDPELARRHAAEATARATSLERAIALCASSWVALCGGDDVRAGELAADAELEARRTADRPSLARALELRGAARRPADESFLTAAAELWREVGDPIAERRTELILASCRGQTERTRALREDLSRRGVAAEYGFSGLAVGMQQRPAEVTITTLGRFAVLRNSQSIPLGAWQSRKARDLLKLLASRRGRRITRDAVAEALWSNQDPGPLSNRLSVALSTLRKVLDPDRSRPPEHFILADSQSLALRLEFVSLDVDRFLDAAERAVTLASRGDWTAADVQLRHAESLYTGDFLEEDLYEDWSVDCREEARAAAQEVSRLLARAAAQRGDDEEATRHLRRVLERDPYDADAWAALLGTQLRLRRYGEARRQHTIYTRRMTELEIPPLPLASTADARP